MPYKPLRCFVNLNLHFIAPTRPLQEVVPHEICYLNHKGALMLRYLPMALKLYIPPCIHDPAHALHPPPLDRPLRVQIEGHLVSIQKLVPDSSWHFTHGSRDFPQPGGEVLAKLTCKTLYGTDIRQEVVGDMIVRDEYLGWVMEGKIPKK